MQSKQSVSQSFYSHLIYSSNVKIECATDLKELNFCTFTGINNDCWIQYAPV